MKELREHFSILLLLTLSLCLATSVAFSFQANATEATVVQESDASTVYQDFLDKISFIENDESWEDFLDAYTIPVNEEGLEEMYADTVEVDSGKTKESRKEEFRSMSGYERFLWIDTYCRVAYQVKTGYLDYIDTKDDFWNTVNFVPNLMSVVEPKNYQQALDAYNTLMEWQFAYIQAHDYPFNFINNRSYLEEVPASNETESVTEKTEAKDRFSETNTENGKDEYLSESDKKEMEEAKQELLKDAETEEGTTVKTTTEKKPYSLSLILGVAVAVCMGFWLTYTQVHKNKKD